MRKWFSSLLVLIVFSAQASQLCHNNCRLVIDAGSSGSRAHLYQYDVDSIKKTVSVRQLWSKSITPGLSAVTLNPDGINAYFTNLMKGAPDENYPMYLLGTAGVRKLSPDQQKKRYDLARNWFEKHFPKRLKKAETIPGQLEGVYGWLSTNYQLGLLQGSAQHLAAVIDMGGVSVQLTLPTDEADANYTLSYMGQTLYLNSTSFLGLGQTEIEHQFAEEKNCYPLQFPLDNGSFGRGNSQACLAAISQGIKNQMLVDEAVRKIVQQYAPEKWVVMGSIAYTANAEALQFNDPDLTVGALLNAANQNVCLNNWYNLFSDYPNDSYLSHYCLDTSYYYAVLVNSFGLQEQQGLDRLSDPTMSDWTVGEVLSSIHWPGEKH